MYRIILINLFLKIFHQRQRIVILENQSNRPVKGSMTTENFLHLRKEIFAYPYQKISQIETKIDVLLYAKSTHQLMQYPLSINGDNLVRIE